MSQNDAKRDALRPAGGQTPPPVGGYMGEDRYGALGRRCPMCGAAAGQECRNITRPGTPLPGRRFHYARNTP